MWTTRVIIVLLLAQSCTARLHQESRAASSTTSLADRICWDDGIECDLDTTCINCCANSSYVSNITNTRICGLYESELSSCLTDGTVCDNETNWECWNCCNGAYENGGKTCGGQCLASGTLCDIDNSCSLCCNYTYWMNGDSYECGCIEDGKSCIPGETCSSCCNGAYNDNGSTCGGTCVEDGTECTIGEDCHLCCTYSTYWYSTGKMQCGSEPCYADGESCIPGQTCGNCCSGGAYDGNGTVCGGSCIQSGNECTYLGTCNNCCQDNGYGVDMSPVGATVEAQVDTNPAPTLYPIGDMWHWNATKGAMECGYEMCWEDGTSCIPGYTCNKCCNGAYNSNGTQCGGQCLGSGAKCDFYSTCSMCCQSYMYNSTLESHTCYDYEDYFPIGNDVSTSSSTSIVTNGND
jgi:hypothetical protein